MIVKGKPRSGPAQLAAYLMRSDERAMLIELVDGGQDLRKAFLSWHAIGEATRGEKTLYHAQIAPETRYPMTPDQWKRAVEILAEELGLAQHPRAIVIHAGDNKPHAHVVFQRADIDTMTLWDDSFNYVKHERASQRMEREFGHEMVPGKHAKRDRDQQPEFPRAAFDQAEAQLATRNDTDPAAFKADVKALYQTADSGAAFKAALEDARYLLAKGERGYLVVDATGGHKALTRQLGLKKKELDAFMAAVPLDSLPDIEAAKAVQKAAREQQSIASTEQQNNAPAAQQQGAKLEAVPSEAEPRSKFVPELAAIPPAPESKTSASLGPARAQLDPAVEKALAARQELDVKKLADWHLAERKQLTEVLDREFAGKRDNLKAVQKAERDRFTRENKLGGIEGFVDAVQRRINPGLGEERKAARAQKWKDLGDRQQREREDYLALFKVEKARELEDLREKHAQQRRDQTAQFAEEKARYLRDAEQAARIRADIERDRQEQERRERERGPEPPRRGK